MDHTSGGLDKLAKQIADLAENNSALLDHCEIVLANAVMIPDPRMEGTTDVYAVPIDDLDALQNIVIQAKKLEAG